MTTDRAPTIRQMAEQVEKCIDAIVSQFSGIGNDVDNMREEVVRALEVFRQVVAARERERCAQIALKGQKSTQGQRAGLLTCEPICQCGHVDVQHGAGGRCEMCSCAAFYPCRAVEDLVQWAYEEGFKKGLAIATHERERQERNAESVNKLACAYRGKIWLSPLSAEEGNRIHTLVADELDLIAAAIRSAAGQEA